MSNTDGSRKTDERSGSGESGYEVISSIEMIEELKDREKREIRVRSGFPSLDKAIDGFVGGELIVISGPTKQGKTLMAQSMTAEFVRQNMAPLWFSYEVTPLYFLRAFPELPLFYMPRRLKMNAIEWVVRKCRESFKQYHTRIIIIDHLHYLFDIARARNPSIEIGTVIRRLKTVAVQNDYIIFLLCHTRKGAHELNHLTYESIRDSSFVSQESDCVMMITRNIKNPDSNEARLLVEFHRRTGVLHKVINLVKIEGYLREVSRRST